MSVGIASGVVVGTAVGFIVKSMSKPKSKMRKTVSGACEAVSAMFEKIAKFTD